MSIFQGTNMIAGSGGGIANYDGKSITENANEEIQTVGVINSRDSSTAVKTWTGTKAQYDALKGTHTMYQWRQSGSSGIFVYTEALRPNVNDPAYDSSYNIIGRVNFQVELEGESQILLDNNKVYIRPDTDESTTTIYVNRIDPNTLYNITDDTDVSLTILEALYPVGSVYITTANTCPLSALISGSTWELVSSGRVLQGADSGHSAGTTIEAGLPNITGDAGIGRSSGDSWQITNTQGAFFNSQSQLGLDENNSWRSDNAGLGFDASRSSSIYGNSSTVQPPAYVVNIYRRTN